MANLNSGDANVAPSSVPDHRRGWRTIRLRHRSRPNNKLEQSMPAKENWTFKVQSLATDNFILITKPLLNLAAPLRRQRRSKAIAARSFWTQANDFSGTVAGMAKHDAIDLADFAFSSHPSITSVAGTGAAGSTTDVTITDASQTTTIHLLNQYANQFAVAPSAYALTSDHSGSASARIG